MTNISLITQSGLVAFVDKKGVAHEITAEGALHKGGNALTALKDAATDLALAKAHNGKYRAAFDIVSNAFPSQYRAYCKLFKAEAWATKTEFASFIGAMENAQPGKNGFTKKQNHARELLASLRGIPAFARSKSEAVTIEAVAVAVEAVTVEAVATEAVTTEAATEASPKPAQSKRVRSRRNRSESEAGAIEA